MKRLELIGAVEAAYSKCQRCPLHRSRTKVVHWRGSATAPLLIIGEAPGADEDAQGRPFVGPAGRKLDEALRMAGLTAEDVFVTNTVACRPPDNRNPLRPEIRACSGRLSRLIQIVRPGAALMLGAVAAKLMGVSSVKQWRGALTEWEYLDHSNEVRRMPAVCSWHPAYILRQGLGEAVLTKLLAKDILVAWKAASNEK